MLDPEVRERAFTALLKAFGVTVADIVTFLTALITKAVLESQKLAELIEAAIDRRISALPAPVIPEMTEAEEQEVEQRIAEIANTTLAEARQSIVDEATAKAIEAARSGTTAAIGQQLTASLADPVQLRQLVTGIINDPEAMDVLQRAIHEASERVKGSIKDRRVDNIGEAIFAIYNERSGGESKLTDEDIGPLVNRIENERVVSGKRAQLYIDTIGAWLVDQESKMAEVITAMAYANTDPAVIDSYARLLISKGITPDNAGTIREHLGKEEIKLKK